MNSSAGFGGHLDTKLIKAPKPHKVKSVRTPFGRVMFTRDKGSAEILAESAFQSHLQAIHFGPGGRLLGIHDLGSGNVQTNFVAALQADQLGTTTNKAAPILANSGKYMYSGTGTTVNTYDYQLATGVNNASGLITPTLGISGNNATLTYVGTITYGATASITEWGLFNTNAGLGAQYSASSFSSVTVSTVTPTTSPSWTVNTWAGYVAVDTSAGNKMTGYVISNTATALTIAQVGGSTGWYNLTSGGGTGTTPATTDTIGIYPLMTDHKTFTSIGVNSGDSIQYTYTLTIQAGG